MRSRFARLTRFSLYGLTVVFATSVCVALKSELVIKVDSSSMIWIDRGNIGVGDIRSRVERFLAELPDGKVTVSVAADAYTDVVVEVIDAAREGGAKPVHLGSSECVYS